MSELFSVREGYNEAKGFDLVDDVPAFLRNRIWNVFMDYDAWKSDRVFIKVLWDGFFKEPIDEIFPPVSISLLVPNSPFQKEVLKKIKEKFDQLKWYEVYDFVEFFLEWIRELHPDDYEDMECDLNLLFEEENVPYRIIDGKVVPLTDKEAIKEIERVFEHSDKFLGVKEHMKKALECYSDRERPDYQNAIKECCCALDSLASALKGGKTTFTKFVKEMEIHGALRQGFEKLYSWTSDAAGIRHGITGEPLPLLPAEARYMLITVSAFINYVIEKYERRM